MYSQTINKRQHFGHDTANKCNTYSMLFTFAQLNTLELTLFMYCSFKSLQQVALLDQWLQSFGTVALF